MKLLILFSLSYFVNHQVYAKDYDSALVTIPKEFSKNDTIEIKNMPPIRSQDGLGLCTSFAVSALFDFYTCQAKKIDCSKISPDQQASVLGIAKYAENTDLMDDPENSNNYKKIRIGGMAGDTCMNIINNFKKIPKESCAPFDLLMNINTTSIQNQKDNIVALESKYKMSKEQKVDCVDCIADDIKALFPFSGSKAKIKAALGEPEYEKFLYSLLLPEKCNQDSKFQITAPSKELDYFPKENEKIDRPGVVNKIKDILKNGTPIIADAVCMAEVFVEPKSKCNPGHSVVISGYSQMCSTVKPIKCYDAFKVHNSWGQKWQDENNDGWILADEFIKRTHNMIGTFSWLK
ncbi:MAG: hypothetical protein Q7U04_13290 [Bacteriovorax sp.]|nr:hypothetical protein [Bacteriovorax sp.]